MRVRPERRGHGQGILSALECLAAELGYVTLHLDPTAGKTAARRLYEKDSSFREARRGLLSGFESVFYEKHLRDKELAGVSG